MIRPILVKRVCLIYSFFYKLASDELLTFLAHQVDVLPFFNL